MKLRATTRSDSLTIVPASVPDIHGGPAGCVARAALPGNVSIADLNVGIAGDPDEEEERDEDEPEAGVVEVDFFANDVPAARQVIKRWAAVTGYSRVWFSDEVAELEPPQHPDGEYGTTCPTCGLRISDSGPDLMGFVREAGAFPMTCFVCGTFVPQWEPVRRKPAREERVAGRVRRGPDVRRLHAVDNEPSRD
ncbi:MAG: hypothetical protein U0R51_01560 [Solirubrobacterales bacterium]